jgi:hypothetical protein
MRSGLSDLTVIKNVDLINQFADERNLEAGNRTRSRKKIIEFAAC